MTFIEELKKHKQLSELQYVVSLYKNPIYLDEYGVDRRKITNKGWRLYYEIILRMVDNKSYNVVDEINVDLYVTQSKDLKKEYDKYGGWATIKEASSIIEEENIQNYRTDVIRYDALIKMANNGLPVERDWEKISDFTYEELHTYSDGVVAGIFSDEESGEDQIHDIKHEMWDMIEQADKGISRGLPVSSRLLNSSINGQILGNITMLAAASGVGKSFLTLCLTMPSFIENEVPTLIMCNEEDLAKWQRELITWVANNVIKNKGKDKRTPFIKSRFYQGNFTTEEWEILKEAKEWVDQKIKDGLITFMSFNSFSMEKAIRQIKNQTATKGIKYFIIDTLKLDNDTGSNVTDLAWLQLQQNMVKLYNVIKPTAKNVHVWVTYQLNKSTKTRFLDQTSLGMSKNVADVVSTLLLTRRVLTNEKSGSGSLTVKTFENKEKQLNPDEDYRIIFVDKNRSGSTSRQIVLGVDMGRNKIRDVGYTVVAEDY